MVMGPARLRPLNECTGNYRPVLSSERTLYTKKKKVTVKHRKIKIWLWTPKAYLTPRRTGRLNVGRKINLNLNSNLKYICLFFNTNYSHIFSIDIRDL
jgi:hypothetical protein